jgi:hypothetical protein
MARPWPADHPCEARFDMARFAVPAGQEGNDFLPLTAPLPGETAKKVHSVFTGTDLVARLEASSRPRRMAGAA